MTKDEFQQWWNARLVPLNKAARFELEAVQCRDTEIAATLLLEKLETYLRRCASKLSGGGLSRLALWHLCCAAIHRRALNYVRDERRKQGVHIDVPLEDVLESQQPSYTMDADVMKQQHVRLVLAAMTLADRDLLLGVYVEGYTLEEVSTQLGKPQRTGVQRAIERAKERFRRIWYAQGYGGDIPRIASGGCRLNDSDGLPPVDPSK